MTARYVSGEFDLDNTCRVGGEIQAILQHEDLTAGEVMYILSALLSILRSGVTCTPEEFDREFAQLVEDADKTLVLQREQKERN